MLPKIRDLLKLHNLTPNKRLGQNFLLDSNITDKIVRHIPNIAGATILEIGSGPGALTRSLLASNANKIYALEFDSNMIKLLNILHEYYPKKMTILEADALNFAEESLPEEKLIIAGNLPYNISVPLLFKWLDKIEKFSSLTLMFQKEVADRICAKPGTKSYGVLSIMAQFCCEISLDFDISPECFYPPPKIWSSVVTLVPKRNQQYNKKLKPYLYKIVSTAFNQRRKTLRNSLAPIASNISEILEKAEINEKLRAENLSLSDYIRICDFTMC